MTPLEVYILDVPTARSLVVVGRRGPDTAVQQIPLDGVLPQLRTFGDRLGQSLLGNESRPFNTELDRFGGQLFDFLFQGTLRALYGHLPTGPVSVQILSDRAEVREVPWEYLRTPDCRPVPHRDRSVIRVHPTCGVYRQPLKKLGKKTRILFVSADPIDQTGVDWTDVQRVYQRTLAAQVPAEVAVVVVRGSTRADLVRIIGREKFDIFHFFGHGDVRAGEGHVVLQDPSTGASDYLSATNLAVALAGKGVQLAILSACLTGAGDHANDFGVLATALITAGIPAVVANQYPIPIKTIAPFVAVIYETLMQHGDIDLAVANGRAQLKAGIQGATGNDAVVEWGVPTLHRLSDAQHLFKAT